MTKITVTGQRPVAVDALDYTPTLTDDPNTGLTGYEYNTAFAGLVEEVLSEPLHPGGAVAFTDDAGTTRDAQYLGDILSIPLHEEHDTVTHNKVAQDILSQMLLALDTSRVHSINRLFLSQLYHATLPAPGSYGGRQVHYTADADILPPAKKYLSDHGGGGDPATIHTDTAEGLRDVFIGIGSAYAPRTLGIAFADEEAFDDYTEYLVQQTQTLVSAGSVDATVLGKMNQIASMGLKELTQALVLRNSTEHIGEEYCFARVLHRLTVDYARTRRATTAAANEPLTCSLMPFHTAEWILPRTMIFINIERHARSSAPEINRCWQSINRQLGMGFTVLDPRKISKLETFSANLSKMKSDVAVGSNKEAAQRRDVNENDFDELPPAPSQAVSEIISVMKSIGNVHRSNNIVPVRRKTLTRASRRRPDDPAAPGRYTSRKYLPDIHFYADKSGSMSIEDSRDTIMLLMTFAARHNINFYFSSFSHVLSKEVMIPVAGRGPRELSRMLKAIPMVSGWTDYKQIYDYINVNRDRSRRLNIVATDFEWLPYSSSTIRHPRNLVYVPAFNRDNDYAWDHVRDSASNFVNAMTDHDPHIRRRLLGMGLNA